MTNLSFFAHSQLILNELFGDRSYSSHCYSFTDRPTHIYPNTLHFISEVSHRDFDLLVGRDFLKALQIH